MSLAPVGPLPAVLVRRATRADVGFLTDVVVVATRAQGRLPDDPRSPDEPGYRDGFAERTLEQVDGGGSGGDGLHVIEVDGARAGRWRVRHGDGHVELCGVQLLPAHQGAGIGTHLVTQLVVDAHAEGLTVRVEVEKDNPRALVFYERLGFTRVGGTDTGDVLESAAAG